MTAGDSGSESSPSPPPRSYKNGTKGGSSSSRRKPSELTKIIQIANLAPQATKEQMQTLFGYIGKIDDLRLYPTVDLGQMSSKICFIKFYDGANVGVAQHLTNTVFIDRALIIVPYMEGEIPDEQKALEILRTGTLLPGIADPKLPQHVTSQIEGMYPHQVVVTIDPKLIENNLPPYPPLPPNHDTRRIEEIRRTLLVANLDPDLKAEELIEFFGSAGEVKYFRFCTRDNDPLQYALIEYTEQPSILPALRLNGIKLGTKTIKVYHSTQAILKPQAKTNEAAQKEIEEAMSRQILSQGLDATTGKDKRRSRSRSHSRRRSRSRGRRSSSRSRRRSRSRSHRRSRSRSKRRSSSRHRHSHRSAKSKKSRSRSPRRSVSRERRSHRSKKRSRSRDRHRKSRTRSPPIVLIKRSRSRSKKREEKVEKLKKVKKVKKEKDRSRERGKDKEKDKDRQKHSEKDREKGKDRDRERDREVSSSKLTRERESSLEYKDNGMDIQDDSN